MQNLGWIFIEMGANLFQGFLVTYFIDHTLQRKTPAKWPSLLCCGCFTFLCSLYLFFNMPSFDTWIFAVPLVYSLVFFEGSLKEKLLWNAVLISIFNGIVLFCYYIFVAAFDVTTTYLLEQNAFRVIFLAATNLTLFVTLFAISRHKRRPLSNVYPLLLFFVNHILVIAIIDILFYIHARVSFLDPWLLLAASLTLLISVSSIFLYEIMATYAERDYERQKKEYQLEAETHRLEELRSINDSLHRLRHDMKNHIQIAGMLISAGRSQEGAAYLKEADRNIFSIFSTGCLPLDSELTMKELEMRHSGIEFEHDLCGLENAPLSDFDLCAVVGNLLDNAIEAISRLPVPPEKPVIILHIHRVRDMLYIECSNPCDPAAILREGERFLTSKKERGHGLGIRNIQAIAQNAQGFSSFTASDGAFHASLAIPYLTEADQHDVHGKAPDQLFHKKGTRFGKGTRDL